MSHRHPIYAKWDGRWLSEPPPVIPHREMYSRIRFTAEEIAETIHFPPGTFMAVAEAEANRNLAELTLDIRNHLRAQMHPRIRVPRRRRGPRIAPPAAPEREPGQ